MLVYGCDSGSVRIGKIASIGGFIEDVHEVFYSHLCCVVFSGAYPSPISFVGRWIASLGKLGVRPNAFLAALFSILSIAFSCVSVNMPRWVAWYLDLSS